MTKLCKKVQFPSKYRKKSESYLTSLCWIFRIRNPARLASDLFRLYFTPPTPPHSHLERDVTAHCSLPYPAVLWLGPDQTHTSMASQLYGDIRQGPHACTMHSSRLHIHTPGQQAQYEWKHCWGSLSGAGILLHLRVRACPSRTESDVPDIFSRHLRCRTAAALLWFISWVRDLFTCDPRCVHLVRDRDRPFFGHPVFIQRSSSKEILSLILWRLWRIFALVSFWSKFTFNHNMAQLRLLS